LAVESKKSANISPVFLISKSSLRYRSGRVYIQSVAHLLKNIAQLAEFAAAEDPKVRQFASVVLELARLRPYRRKRYRGLRRTHPELLRRLIEVGILDDYGPYDQMDFEFDPEEMSPYQDEEERKGFRKADPQGSEAADEDLPFFKKLFQQHFARMSWLSMAWYSNHNKAPQLPHANDSRLSPRPSGRAQTIENRDAQPGT